MKIKKCLLISSGSLIGLGEKINNLLSKNVNITHMSQIIIGKDIYSIFVLYEYEYNPCDD